MNPSHHVARRAARARTRASAKTPQSYATLVASTKNSLLVCAAVKTMEEMAIALALTQTPGTHDCHRLISEPPIWLCVCALASQAEEEDTAHSQLSGKSASTIGWNDTLPPSLSREQQTVLRLIQSGSVPHPTMFPEQYAAERTHT